MSRWTALVNRLQAGTLYGLVLLLPFSKAAVEITFGILLVSWLAARLHPRTRTETLWRRVQFRWLAWAAAAFLGACVLSIPGSTQPDLGVRGFVGKWLEYVLLWMIVADVAQSPAVVHRSLNFLACSGLLVVLEGFWQEITGHGLFRPDLRLNIFNRMTGPYENPIDLGTYFMVVIPVVLMAAMSRRSGGGRWLLWGALGAMVLGLARTWALGAIVGLCLGLFVMVLAEPKFRRHGVVLAMVVVGSSAFFLHRAGYLGEKLSLSGFGKTDRWMMWQAAVGMIKDRPWFGQGLNTFMANYLTYWVGGEQMPRYAHNCYLQMAAETGFVGLSAFVWLLASQVRGLLHGIRRAAIEEHMMLLGCLGGLSAFLAQAAIDTNFYSLRQAALFWTLAGLATGMAGRTLTAPASSLPRT